MFGLGLAISIIQERARQAEEESFDRLMRSASPEMRVQMISDRKEKKTRDRREAIEERRHREMVEAIKSTKNYHGY